MLSEPQHWEALRAIVCSTLRSVLGDNQGCDAVDKATQMVSQLCDLNGSPVNIPDVSGNWQSPASVDFMLHVVRYKMHWHLRCNWISIGHPLMSML